MNSPEASIIVPTRAGAKRLPTLFRALAQQDTEDFEVIVVIDGDIDGSQGVVRNWAGQINIRAIVFDRNRGRTTALNAGADAAQGRVLIRCDDDLEPAPGYVSTHIRQHKGPESGAIGLYLNTLPDTPYALAYGRVADARFRRQAHETSPEYQWRYWAGNVSVLKTVHQRIGGYDARYKKYGWEDVDYGYRLKQTGVHVTIVPELETIHHVAATTTATRALRALHSGAARETFIRIHGTAALPATQPGNGPWERLVQTASTMATERTLRAYGSTADLAIRKLPKNVSQKLVALAVESGGLAGIRYPHRARSRF